MRVRVCISSPFFLYVFLFRIWNEFTSSSSSIFQIASVSIAKHNAQWKWLFIVSHGHSRCLFSENANVNNEVYNNNKRTQKQQTMWKTETKIIECDCIAPSLSLFSLEINFDGCWNAIVSVRVNECTFKFHCNSIGSKNAIEKKIGSVDYELHLFEKSIQTTRFYEILLHFKMQSVHMCTTE